MGSVRLGFTEEYRENSVSLVIEDSRAIAEAALGVGIKPQTLETLDAESQTKPAS
jgi:hypothetical protein